MQETYCIHVFFLTSSYVRSIFVTSTVVTFHYLPNLRRLTIHGPGFIVVPIE